MSLVQTALCAEQEVRPQQLEPSVSCGSDRGQDTLDKQVVRGPGRAPGAGSKLLMDLSVTGFWTETSWALGLKLLRACGLATWLPRASVTHHLRRSLRSGIQGLSDVSSGTRRV